MSLRKLFLKSGFLVLCVFNILVSNAQRIDRTNLYKALASNSTAIVDAQIKKLSGISGNDRNAFEGALLMRKAGLVSVPAKKMSLFKQGHKKLETAIGAEKNNAEYRFLRLLIQENAPKSLGYNKNITEDSKLIQANYNSLPATVQQSILTYSKKSKALPSSAL